jgi:hypothetical protein
MITAPAAAVHETHFGLVRQTAKQPAKNHSQEDGDNHPASDRRGRTLAGRSKRFPRGDTFRTDSAGKGRTSAPTLTPVWDVLTWQNDTLSVAWWALVAFAVLVIIAAGSQAARK